MYKFYIYPGNYSELIQEGLARRENWVEEQNKSAAFKNCQFIWKPTNISVTGYNKLNGLVRNRPKNFLQPIIIIHFVGSAGYNVFDSTPTSFIITAGVEDHENTLFITRFRELEKHNVEKEKTPLKHCQANIWLVKPANLNQGRGIQVFRTLKDIYNFLSSRSFHSFWVVQKYIEKPLLYHGRKFDIRIWVIMTHKNEVFIYKKGYIRTSSNTFDLNNKNNYVHLTNNCLQQKGDNYGAHEEGNTLPLETLDQYFEQQYPGKNVKLDTHIIPRMKDLIIDTFLCAKPELNPLHRPNVFELFGYDFMIDEDLRTWLIEVNTNPYLGTPNEYIGNLLPKMIDDMLEITTDHLFAPKADWKKGRPNDFELVYCETGSLYHDGPFNVRSSFTKSVYPIQELTPPDVLAKEKSKEKRIELVRGKILQSRNLKVSENIKTEPTNLYKAKANDTENASPEKQNQENITNIEPIFVEDMQKTTNLGAQTMEEELELQDEGSDVSSDDQENNNKVTSKSFHKGRKLKFKTKTSHIETIYKNLHLACVYKTNLDPNIVTKDLTIILSCLKNWELISSKKTKLACKALKLIAQSSASFLLAAPKVVEILAKLFKSSNVGLDIKLSIIETMNIIIKEESLKRKLINTKLIHELIKICLDSCDETEIQNYSKLILVTALRCLINLGMTYFKKSVVSSEAKEYEKIRASYMGQGALIAIWMTAYQSLDPYLREIAFKSFLVNVDNQSLERQLEILNILKIIPETNTENEDSDTEEFNKAPELITYPAGAEDQTKTKTIAQGEFKEVDSSTIFYEAILHSNVSVHHLDKMHNLKTSYVEKNEGNSISFPKTLLKMYSLDKLINEFREYMNCFNDTQTHKEIDEKEKKSKETPKEERKKYNTVEENQKIYIPKIYKKFKDKLKLEQLSTYYKSKKEISPGRTKDSFDRSQITYTVPWRRGTSMDNYSKTPEGSSKLFVRKIDKTNGDSDFDINILKPNALTTQSTKRDGKRKSKVFQTSRSSSPYNIFGIPRIHNHLFTGAIKSELRPANNPNLDNENPKPLLPTKQGNSQSVLPQIQRKSDKKIRSSLILDGTKVPKPEALAEPEYTGKENFSKTQQKQFNFVYPSPFQNEVKDQLIGNKEIRGRIMKMDLEAIGKLMNNRNFYPKKSTLRSKKG